MSEMSRASAVRRAWGAIGAAEKALAAGNFAAAAAGLDLTRAILQFAHVLGEVPPAELNDAAPAPMPMMRPDETAILPVAQQGARTTISVPLRHQFVPGHGDHLHGPASSWCAYRLPDGDFCGAPPLHAAHTVVRHAFAPGLDPMFCAHPISDRLSCALYAKHSVHDVAPVEPFAPGHMPREFP